MTYFLIAPLYQGAVLSPEEYRLKGYEDYQIAETIPPGYADISSVISWFEIGSGLSYDFLFIKERVKEQVAFKGIAKTQGTINSPDEVAAEVGDCYLIGGRPEGIFTGKQGAIAHYTEAGYAYEDAHIVGYRQLTEAEQLVALKNKIGDTKELYAQFGVAEVKRENLAYHKSAIAAREARLLRAEIQVYHEIPVLQSQLLQELLFSPIGDLTYFYQHKGILGIEEDYHHYFNPQPTPGIADKLLGRSIFEGNGLVDKDWQTVSADKSIADLAHDLVAILVEGVLLF